MSSTPLIPTPPLDRPQFVQHIPGFSVGGPIFKDKTFSFITKSPPAAILLKKAAGVTLGSREPNKTKVGKLTKEQVMEIVKIKKGDLNTEDEEAAFRILTGTARQAGIEVLLS